MRGKCEFPAVLVQLATQHCEQRGLARAIGTDQTDILTRLHCEVGMVEHHFRSTPQRDSLQPDHARTRSAASTRTTVPGVLVGNQTTGNRANAASKCSRSLPISTTSTPCGAR